MSSICTCTVHTYLSNLVRNGNQLQLGLQASIVHAKTLYEDRGVQTSYGNLPPSFFPIHGQLFLQFLKFLALCYLYIY